MTLEEFKKVRPDLAWLVALYAERMWLDGVYEGEGGRWEAHFIHYEDGTFERLYEARCHPNCQRGPGGPHLMTWEGHTCCEQCKGDPMHHYQAVHE